MTGGETNPREMSATPSAITQCPHCRARFRIRAEQVKAHAGLVRCGACRGVFDAVAHITEGRLVLADQEEAQHAANESPRTIIPGFVTAETAPDPGGVARTHPPASPPFAEAMPTASPPPASASASLPEDPADTLVEPAVSQPLRDPRHSDDAEATATLVRNTDYEAWQSARRRAKAGGATAPVSEGSPGYRWRKPSEPMSTAERLGWAVLTLFAASALVLQGLYVFRDTLAARLPQSQPVLVWLCGWVDCRIAPPRALSSAGFVSSELAADPAHRGLLILSATLRNSSDTPVAFPHLILTLEATDGQPVARKVFSPEQYLPASAKVDQGLPGNTDVEVKLYLDASQVNAVGFKVDQAYL
ncbi:MAG: DUF3426 domain-containing protein [Casimicrobiaceae bacterium]